VGIGEWVEANIDAEGTAGKVCAGWVGEGEATIGAVAGPTQQQLSFILLVRRAGLESISTARVKIT